MGIRPIPEDSSSEEVKLVLEQFDDSWALANAGDYMTFAVDAFKNDGSNHQKLLALVFPARLNNTDEDITIRLLLSPEDAQGLAETMAHTVAWLRSLDQLSN